MTIVNKKPESEYRENINTIEELKYFNPFVRLKNQSVNLITSDFISCNLFEQHIGFLKMACFDFVKAEVIKNILIPKLLNRLPHIKEQSMHKNIKSETITVSNIIMLNTRIKETKAKIQEDLNTIKNSELAIMLVDPTNGITFDNKETFEYNIPYIYYLKAILNAFILFNTLEAQTTPWLSDIRNKIFKFKNNTELLNFKGCLGLLLMNEFCFYYHNNDIQHSILCAMLITNFYTYLSPDKIMEKSYLEELDKLKIALEETRKQKSIAGSTTKNEKYKKHCIEYMKDKNLSAKKAAEELASEFIEHPSDIRNEYDATLGTKKKKTKDGYERIELPQYDPEQTIRRWLENAK